MKNIIQTLKNISLRDALLVFGLGLMGYGLYLFSPALSFTVCGALILAGAYRSAD